MDTFMMIMAALTPVSMVLGALGWRKAAAVTKAVQQAGIEVGGVLVSSKATPPADKFRTDKR
jgi:hypothetical protein